MSEGKMLLRAIIENGARSEMRRLTPELFLPDERKAYDTVLGFYRRHGRLPDLDVLAENGVTLPHAPQPATYYHDRLTARAKFLAFTGKANELNAAVRDQNADRLAALISEIHYAMSRVENADDVISLTEAYELVLEQHAEARDREASGGGLSYGLPFLDVELGAPEPGDTITFAARPNVGKSQLMAKIATDMHAAGASVLFLSMEMTADQIARRMLGIEAGVNHDFLRRGTLSTYGEEHVRETIRRSERGAPFHLIRGNFKKSVPVLDAAILEFSPDVVFVDASYLMSPAQQVGKMAGHELLAAVEKDLKEVAMARKRPIIKSVQLNREAEDERPKARNKRKGDDDEQKPKRNAPPTLAMIFGSDAAAQINSFVVALTPGDAPFEMTRRRLHILKAREGEGKGKSFQINFLFDPPNFDWVPDEEGSSGDMDGSWMM